MPRLLFLLDYLKFKTCHRYFTAVFALLIYTQKTNWTLYIVLTPWASRQQNIKCYICLYKRVSDLLPQPSSSEASVQSLRPSQCFSLGMHMRLRQVQSDSKQPREGKQFSSSEPLGHWICPSQRADMLTQPKESRQGK